MKRKHLGMFMDVALKMTASTGIATAERAKRAKMMADVCATHECHWTAVTFGVEFWARAQAPGHPGCQIR